MLVKSYGSFRKCTEMYESYPKTSPGEHSFLTDVSFKCAFLKTEREEGVSNISVPSSSGTSQVLIFLILEIQ